MMEKQNWRQLKQFKLPYFGKIIEQIAFFGFNCFFENLQLLWNKCNICETKGSLSPVVKQMAICFSAIGGLWAKGIKQTFLASKQTLIRHWVQCRLYWPVSFSLVAAPILTIWPEFQNLLDDYCVIFHTRASFQT